MSSRILTVSSTSSYNYKPVPYIRIQGKWLESLGFHIGDKILIGEEYERLVIHNITRQKELTIK